MNILGLKLAEEISELLGVKSELIINLIRVLGVAVTFIIFLIFFSFHPTLAIILFGFLTLIAGLYFKNDKGIYAGFAILAIGIAVAFIPQLAEKLAVLSRTLNELLVL